MKIVFEMMEIWVAIICGEKVMVEGQARSIFPRRKKPELISFFNSLGIKDQPGMSSIPTISRSEYTREKLKEIKERDNLTSLIELVVSPVYYLDTEYDNKYAAEYLNKYLNTYGLQLRPNSDGAFLLHDTKYSNTCFNSGKLETLSHDFIREQLKKINDKINSEDYDGAITNSRSLVEAIFEELIKKLDNIHDIEGLNGDLLKMYKIIKKKLNLDPSNNELDQVFKQVLSGLNSVVTGIAGISNKLADRHNRKCKVKKHHANLAARCAYTLCEFLLNTHEMQVQREVQRAETESINA